MHDGSRRQTSFARLERLCRQHGLALTVQRRLIFAALAERRDHPTADQVYAAVRDRLPGVSRTTVYRVLETFVRAGVIAVACHPGAAARYDPLTHRHHHLVCLRCGKIVDLEDPRLDALPMPRVRGRDFQINDYSVHFRGVCARCRIQSATKPTTKRPRKARKPTRRKRS